MSRYGISDAELATFGAVIIEVALVDFQVSAIHQMLCGDEGNGLRKRLNSVRKAIMASGDSEMSRLCKEFDWGMDRAVTARDLIAHGIALADEDSGAVTMFSPDRHSSMTVKEICTLLPKVQYAAKCATHMVWRLGGVPAPNPLPKRPR